MPRMKGTANKTKQLTLSEVIEIHNARIAANMPCNGCMCKDYCQEKAKYEMEKLNVKMNIIKKVIEEYRA